VVQDIDPVYLLGPIVTVAFSAALVLYWAFRRRFKGSVLVYTLVAYGGAIALKYAVQIPTVKPFTEAFGSVSIATGLYFGIQTALFEVGLAYVVARFAVGREKLTGDDAEAYGLGLAFWENGVLLGVFSVLSLSLDYIILAGGSTDISQQVYQQLLTSDPGLFSPPAQALPSVFFSVLERVSSTLAHFSWGYLTLLSAFRGKRSLFLVALPMGLLDALVPFASRFSVPEFEGMVFVLSLSFLAVSLAAKRSLGSDEISGGRAQAQAESGH
jgi:hypothetical protein